MYSMPIAAFDECIGKAAFVKKWITSRGIVWQYARPMGFHPLHASNASAEGKRWQHHILKPDWWICGPYFITK